jgi:hypothetical protein
VGFLILKVISKEESMIKRVCRVENLLYLRIFNPSNASLDKPKLFDCSLNAQSEDCRVTKDPKFF